MRFEILLLLIFYNKHLFVKSENIFKVLFGKSDVEVNKNLSRAKRQATTGLTCGLILPPLFGQIKYGPSPSNTDSAALSYPAGTIATLGCTNGMVTNGQTSTTCENGAWTQQFGTCQPSTSAGQNTGCLLNGQASSVLPAIGTNLDLPNTGGIGCPQPDSSNGQISYTEAPNGVTYPSGTAATITCPTGTVTGSPMSTCNNGLWTPTLGTCLPASSTPFGTGATQGGCLTPIVLNGQIQSNSAQSNGGTAGVGLIPGISTYPLGTVVIVQCNPGFTATSSPTTTCQSGGIWSPTPVCSLSGSGILGGATPMPS